MTTYTHKKSLRHITDEQFSEKTTVDGSRIDRALQESVDHVNSIPPGDVLSRYTESRFAFGYQPVRHYATPSGLGVGRGCLTTAGDFYYAHHFPWLQIANNADLTLGEARDAQNPYTVKAVALESAGHQYNVSNSGPVPYDDPAGTSDWPGDWADWAAAGTATGDEDYTTTDGPDHGYQYAYTNAWNFNKPAIIDDLMITLSIDKALVSGNNGAAFENPAGTVGTDVVSVVLMVDNHFSQELRADSEIEIASSRYDLRGFKRSFVTVAPLLSVDMLPSMGGTPTLPNKSVEIRWRDLNIPLHENARVRLSIVIPWQKDGVNPSGLTYVVGGAEKLTAPFFYCTFRGCMTVLEELEP